MGHVGELVEFELGAEVDWVREGEELVCVGDGESCIKG